MQITDIIDIDAPIERVWELTVDVEAWPRYTPTMTSVERLDDGEFGHGPHHASSSPASHSSASGR